jgi:D-glycero-alpha-D-manno-heptose-7-phosphate kinase
MTHQTTIINAVAPTRICDVGGWTDTHFARTGAVFYIAVYPYVEVQVHSLPVAQLGARLVIDAENYGDTYTLNPDQVVYDRHPLIEATINVMELPKDIGLRINLFAHAPPGASMGTSAAVSVALIGALDALTEHTLSPYDIAALAHSIETKELGLECGVQDQLASVYGGINFIEILEFPNSRVSKVELSDNIWWELEHRLLLAYIGRPHFSSDIHKRVIAGLGDEPHDDARLEQLRQLAYQSRDALFSGDFVAMGRAFNENTQVQRELHKDLICDEFEAVISLSEEFGALGCKVNGAGGDGGSIAILTNGDTSQKRALQRALDDHGFQTLPIYLARRGLRVWKTVSNRIPGEVQDENLQCC